METWPRAGSFALAIFGSVRKVQSARAADLLGAVVAVCAVVDAGILGRRSLAVKRIVGAGLEPVGLMGRERLAGVLDFFAAIGCSRERGGLVRANRFPVEWRVVRTAGC